MKCQPLVKKRENCLSLTCTALVQQAERAAPEGGEAHTEHSADVAVYRRGDNAFLQTERSLVHKPGKTIARKRARPCVCGWLILV